VRRATRSNLISLGDLNETRGGRVEVGHWAVSNALVGQVSRGKGEGTKLLGTHKVGVCNVGTTTSMMVVK
jgi:hypothetical protein